MAGTVIVVVLFPLWSLIPRIPLLSSGGCCQWGRPSGLSPELLCGSSPTIPCPECCPGKCCGGERASWWGCAALYFFHVWPWVYNCSRIFLCNWAEDQAEINGNHKCEPFHMGHIRACCRPGFLLGRSDLWNFIILFSSILKMIKNWIFLWETQILFIKIVSLFFTFSCLFIYF